MGVALTKYYRELVRRLDAFSGLVSEHTYNFGNLRSASSLEPNDKPMPRVASVAWRATAEPLIVLCVLFILALYSRQGQFDVMALAPESYFLADLRNVSTTNDAGFFMQMASTWKTKIIEGLGFWQLRPSELPGYLIGALSLFLAISLEEAGRIFVYIAVTLTAFSAYLLLLSLRQSHLGILVASAIVFFFPVYGRTSLGMVDTDQLNLFFLLLILTALMASIRSRNLWLASAFALGAALLYHLFTLWYPRPGFLLMFLATYVAMLVSHQEKIKRAFVLLCSFLVVASARDYGTAWQSLQSFLRLYVPTATDTEALSTKNQNLVDVEALIFQTIGEISGVTKDLISNDYGSVIAFICALIGIVIWLFQDWRRFSVALPFVAFLMLYFVAGLRFSFYAAPLTLVGLFVILASVVNPIVRSLKIKLEKLRRYLGSGLTNPHVTAQPGAAPYRYLLPIRILSIVLMLTALRVANVLPPPGVIPPPVVRAEEIRQLTKALTNADPKKAIVVSWWDYGYEIRYQTGFQVVTDGGNPANIKNIYIARALISPNWNYAADEIRFSAYFAEADLRESFPRRPELQKAIDLHKDIYIFFPSDLQDKMLTIFNIATATIPRESLQGYDSDNSAFVILYHQQPSRWGPFELIHASKEAGVIYRLRSPSA